MQMLHFCKLSNYIIQSNVILMYVFHCFPRGFSSCHWIISSKISPGPSVLTSPRGTMSSPPRFATKPARRRPRKRWTPAIFGWSKTRPIGWMMLDGISLIDGFSRFFSRKTLAALAKSELSISTLGQHHRVYLRIVWSQ